MFNSLYLSCPHDYGLHNSSLGITFLTKFKLYFILTNKGVYYLICRNIIRLTVSYVIYSVLPASGGAVTMFVTAPMFTEVTLDET